MNYYNPYFNSMPYNMSAPGIGASKSLLKGITGKFSWSKLLSGTQKTLGFINQVIPVVKQVTPVVKNAKTMFRVMNEFKKVDTPTNTEVNDNKKETSDIKNTTKVNSETIKTYNNAPTFFQ